ncbi:hypothetical protein ACWEQL_37455, partial [Kitasatospora sp. NPDC004240]
ADGGRPPAGTAGGVTGGRAGGRVAKGAGSDRAADPKRTADGDRPTDNAPAQDTAPKRTANGEDRPTSGTATKDNTPAQVTDRKPGGDGNPPADSTTTRDAAPARDGTAGTARAATQKRTANPTAAGDARAGGQGPRRKRGGRGGAARPPVPVAAAVAAVDEPPAEGTHDTTAPEAAPPAVPPAHSTEPRPGPVEDGGFEEFYAGAHTRLVQQTFLLTGCRHRAVHCVGRAFGEAQQRWDEVGPAADPEGWVRGRAFEAALSPWHRGGPRRAHMWRLPHRRIRVRPADESQAVLPEHDRLTARDRALLKALRRLSRPRRRALVLHDGLGLPAPSVALEVESTLAAAEGRVWAARTSLARWVPELVGPDPAADGFADRLSGLMHRTAVRGCPEPHRPAVPLLRARYRLRDATLTGGAALLVAVMGAAVVATLVGRGPADLFRPAEAPPPAVCATTGDTVRAAADAPPEAGIGAAVPLVPGGPPNGVRSVWCSTTPGVPPVVVDPPPPRDPRFWEVGPDGGALPPPSTGPSADAVDAPGAVCAWWTPGPCPTGVKRRA